MAVHVLAVLAHKDGDSLLASSVNTNPVLIRRLLRLLQAARLVETREGAGLGSRLACAAERINLAEVYRAEEAHEPFLLPSRQPNGQCPVAEGIRRAVAEVFVSVESALERDLGSVTLADMLASAMRKR